MSELAKKIEALLLYAAEPCSIKYLSEFLKVPVSAIEGATEELMQSLHDHGIVLVRDAQYLSLVTAPHQSETIEAYAKKEREAPLSNAATEVLSIIAYRGKATKQEIDFIRGVNSQYTLRSLMMRGLILKETESKSAPVYSGTTELLSFLGLTSWDALPNKDALVKTYEDLLTTVTPDESSA